MTIPTTCEENAILQTKILLAIARVLGVGDDMILGTSSTTNTNTDTDSE